MKNQSQVNLISQYLLQMYRHLRRARAHARSLRDVLQNHMVPIDEHIVQANPHILSGGGTRCVRRLAMVWFAPRGGRRPVAGLP